MPLEQCITVYNVQCDALRLEHFCGDFVLDSVKITFRDGHSRLYQIYDKQIFPAFTMMISFLLNNDFRNAY